MKTAFTVPKTPRQPPPAHSATLLRRSLQLRVTAPSPKLEENHRRIAELEQVITRLRGELESTRSRNRELLGRQAHFDSSPLGYVLLDHAGLILDANHTFFSMVGGSRRAGPKTPFLHFLPREAQSAFLKYFHECQSARKCGPAYLTLLDAKRGKIIPVELFANPVPSLGARSGGKLVRIGIVNRSERSLERSAFSASGPHVNYQSLVDSVPGVVWHADAKSLDILYVSRSAEALLGYPSSYWYRSGFWADHVHVSDRERILTAIAKAIRDHARGHALEYRIVAADRRVLWVRDTITVTEEKGKLRILGVAIDITDLKLLEQNNLEMQEALEAKVAHRTADLQETVAHLETFSYTLSHDLRAPLRAMQGYAQILQTRAREKLGPQEKDFLDRIIRSCTRMDELVQDVLKYNRLARTPLEMKPVELEKVVADVLLDNSTLQPPKARVEIKHPLHPVLGHEAMLTQCVSNLLLNAAKFVPPGVVPHITVRTEAALRAPGVKLIVQDNGIGIDPRDQKRIFGIFQRVYGPDKYDGTGMGLAIVQKVAERMGGKVGLESAPGRGSSFWVQLQSFPRAVT